MAEFQSFIEAKDAHPLPQSGAQNFMSRVCTFMAWDELTTSWRLLEALQQRPGRSDGQPLVIARAALEKGMSSVELGNRWLE